MMTEENPLVSQKTKSRIVYGLMITIGIFFILTPVLPVSTITAQFLATLLFGVMTGLWVSHLVYNT